MKKALIFLVTGFEEIEALATVDILRRGGVEIKTVSLTEEKTVVGSHSIPVIADELFDNADFSSADILILPGGTVRINEHDGLKEKLIEFNNRGKNIAAICAAPMVLGGLGLLKGKKATCYPGFEKYLDGAELATKEAVVVQGNIVTGRGTRTYSRFCIAIIRNFGRKRKKRRSCKRLTPSINPIFNLTHINILQNDSAGYFF